LVFRAGVGLVAVIGLELLYALFKPVPQQDEFDPSAQFGDPGLPGLKIAVLGDSTVTAPGVSGPEDIWVARICRRLAETHRVVLRSFAVGGAMAHNLIEAQLEPALEFDPDVVILSVGANDALKGVTPGRFEANLETLVRSFRVRGITVIQSGVGDLGTIPRLYPPLRQLLSRRAQRFNRAHETVAARNESHVVPQRDRPLEIWAERDMWSADLFHVSAKGHEVWGELGWRTLSRALELDADEE
jgi:lysophospholipase L1-like esterase